jgi:hypothetical protein
MLNVAAQLVIKIVFLVLESTQAVTLRSVDNHVGEAIPLCITFPFVILFLLD